MQREVKMGWTSLENSTDREAGAGRLGVRSTLFPWAARFAAVVQVSKHAAMSVANRSTESLRIKLQLQMGKVEASLRSRPYHFIQHNELWRHLVACTRNTFVGGANLRSAATGCRFSGGCWLAPACWGFEFRVANSRIPSRPLGNECGCGKLPVWEIATAQSLCSADPCWVRVCGLCPLGGARGTV
jgi:hypothetical protein